MENRSEAYRYFHGPEEENDTQTIPKAILEVLQHDPKQSDIVNLNRDIKILKNELSEIYENQTKLKNTVTIDNGFAVDAMPKHMQQKIHEPVTDIETKLVAFKDELQKRSFMHQLGKKIRHIFHRA